MALISVHYKNRLTAHLHVLQEFLRVSSSNVQKKEAS